MTVAETKTLLRQKILKVLSFLFVIRLALYIPVPGIDLDIFSQTQELKSLFGIARNLTGSSFIGLGSLGIIPYINASIIIQLLTPIIPRLNKLQKDEGEIGRQEIRKYTRFLTLGWALILSSSVAIFLVKPLVFNWSTVLALKIIISLTTGSMISMWFAELITNENIGNGSSLIIFINIVGGITLNFNDLNSLKLSSIFNSQVLITFLIYILLVRIIVLVQYAYKTIKIVSARQLNANYLEQQEGNSVVAKRSYIPIKLNQGGIMPLVFSTTTATLLISPLQILLTTLLKNNAGSLGPILTNISLLLNVILIIFFSTFYSLLVLKPRDLSENLKKMAYTIPGLKQGNETIKYLEQTITRLAFIGGIFLAAFAFFPFILNNIFQVSSFKNVTSLIILIGVITDVSSQIRGYLVSQNYESFKTP